MYPAYNPSYAPSAPLDQSGSLHRGDGSTPGPVIYGPYPYGQPVPQPVFYPSSPQPMQQPHSPVPVTSYIVRESVVDKKSATNVTDPTFAYQSCSKRDVIAILFFSLIPILGLMVNGSYICRSRNNCTARRIAFVGMFFNLIACLVIEFFIVRKILHDDWTGSSDYNNYYSSSSSSSSSSSYCDRTSLCSSCYFCPF